MSKIFTDDRMQEILQARDELSKGGSISQRDACDLVLWYSDELDRVRDYYQHQLAKIAILAAQSVAYPDEIQ